MLKYLSSKQGPFMGSWNYRFTDVRTPQLRLR